MPTYLVADLECVLTKLDEKKGVHTRYIHKHQPCAFVIVVMTKYKEAPFNRDLHRDRTRWRDTDGEVCGHTPFPVQRGVCIHDEEHPK